MRLLSLEVAGFRAFSTKQTFDLDADAVIVVGANGNGKTSLFDAVLWAISGRIPRLGDEASSPVCRFSENGQARVVLRLTETKDASPVTITRIFDGSESRASVETKDEVLRGPAAEGRIIELIWKEAAAAVKPAEALAKVLTRSVYLQQDVVREFIDSVTDQERFAVVSELVGAGRVTDLQVELEKAKKSWSTATNSRIAELQPLRSRLATMESRLTELRARPEPVGGRLNEEAWSSWWVRLKTLTLDVNPVPMASRDAASAIDSTIKQIDAARRAVERRQQLLDALIQELGTIVGKATPELAPLRETIVARQRQLEEMRQKVTSEQARVAEARRLQSELKEKSEQLQALAALALKHLGDKCPVCDQEYDVAATRDRLQGIAVTGISNPQRPAQVDALPALLNLLSSQEKELAAAELALSTAEQATRALDASESAVQKRLAELGIDASPSARLSSLREQAQLFSRQSDVLREAQGTGEALAAQLSQVGDQAMIGELLREIEATRGKLQQEDKELAQRAMTGDLAQQIIEALREAASRVVTERVKEIEPLLSDIYSRIDVHPAFRVVRFLASVVHGRGRLSTIVSDPLMAVECDSPGIVLSSSQMNALAVCIFLSLNLGITLPPLEVAILDDPLQSLDDVNLLGLVDLLRRTKDQRQICVSTHDARFGALLARKLRPRSAQQRTVVIELEGWSRAGPTVHTRQVQSDPAPIRLVAA